MDDFMSLTEDAELMMVFLQEAREQLDLLDQGLISLERDPSNFELVNAIFRATHTLKGSSAAMGFSAMAELTHAMEDLLDLIRSSALAVTSKVMDSLLHGLDALRGLELALENGQTDSLTEEEVANITRELRRLTAVQEAESDKIPHGEDCIGHLPENQVCVLASIVNLATLQF
jgi:two-component system chemotaxis sensor kinase CheA